MAASTKSDKAAFERLSASAIGEIAREDLSPGMTQPPEDVAHDDGMIRAWDGIDLYWRSWVGSDEPRAVVCLMHGFGEHSGRYHHVAAFLARAGYAVIAIDARGHGRSTGVRGFVKEYDEYARDLDRLLTEADSRFPSLPKVVLGHSNGGHIALRHAMMAPGKVPAYAVTAPWLGLAFTPPLIKRAAGNVLNRVWPTLAIPTELDTTLLTHNRDVVAQYDADPLNLSTITTRGFAAVTSAQKDTMRRAQEIRAPFLFLVPGADGVASAEASQEVFHRLGSPDRELELLPDLFHEPLNEPIWDELMEKIVEWFERHLASA